MGATSALAGTEDSGGIASWGVSEVLGLAMPAAGLGVAVWIIHSLMRKREWPLGSGGGRVSGVSPAWGFAVVGMYFVLLPMIQGVLVQQWGLGSGEGQGLRERTLAFWVNYVLFVPVLIVWLARCRGGVDSDGAGSGRAVTEGIKGFVVVLPLVGLASAAGAMAEAFIRGERPDVIAHQTLQSMTSAERDGWWWLAAAGLATLTPVCEEVIFRGTIQRIFKEMGLRGASGTTDQRARTSIAWTAIVLSSFVFACMHANVVPISALPALFVLAMGLGVMYERSGSLITPIVMHGLFNAWNIGMMTLLATSW